MGSKRKSATSDANTDGDDEEYRSKRDRNNQVSPKFQHTIY